MKFSFIKNSKNYHALIPLLQRGLGGFIKIQPILFFIFFGFEIANAQSQLASAKIKGATKVDFNQAYTYELTGVKGATQKGKWKLIPSESGVISDDTASVITIQWKKFCSKAKLEWNPIENPNIILATEITIKACAETKKKCLLDKPFQAGMIDAHTILQNGIWVKYQCDTSNAMTVELRLDDAYTTKLSIHQTDNIQWFSIR
jgi:hypothetical protein